MEWIRRNALSGVPMVNDLEELLQVMEWNDLTEFQYVVEDENGRSGCLRSGAKDKLPGLFSHSIMD